MTWSLTISYLNLLLILFFITFFTDIFYYYFRYKTLQPREKMFTFKKGGIFEHYRIVGVILAVIVILHAGFDINPFAEQITDNPLALIISLFTMFFTVVVFLIFFFLITLFLFYYIYAKVKKIEQTQHFLMSKGHKIVKTSFTASFVLSTAFIILIILGL
ncbi:MAG: hypothetical protein ACQEQA_01545 [Bacillota bacterium]